MRITSLGIVGNPYKRKAASIAERLILWCRRHRIRTCVNSDLLTRLKKSPSEAKRLGTSVKKTDLIVCLGGDGYLLTLARTFYPCSTPVLPVNVGNLGFNSQVEPEALLEVLRELSRGKAHYQKRMLLRYELVNDVNKKNIKGVALNDLLVHKTTHSRLVHLRLTIDNVEVTTYRADGLLVASPTGSTAYNLSANGPILHPEAKGIVVLPICPHSLHSRCIVIPETSTITITEKKQKRNEESVMSVDGQVYYDLEPGDILRIRKAPRPLILTAARYDTFFSNLREKLRWGGSIDDEI